MIDPATQLALDQQTFSMPQQQDNSKDFLKMFIEEAIDSQKKDLFMKLSGYVEVYEVVGNDIITKIVPKKELRLCNSEGVTYIMSIVDDYFNSSILMANFDDNEVQVRLKQKAEEMRLMIFNNKNTFEIDQKHWMRIWSLVMAKIDIALHIAKNGQFQKFMKTTQRINRLESFHSHPKGESTGKGFFSLLNPFSGKR